MIEPTVSLALTLESNPGAYACLLGPGVSATSGIPTGWGIVVERVARSLGENPGDDPAAWYEARYGEEPNYSKLKRLTPSPPHSKRRKVPIRIQAKSDALMDRSGRVFKLVIPILVLLVAAAGWLLFRAI